MYSSCLIQQSKHLARFVLYQEDEDEEAEVPSETEAGEEDEVDVCTVERIPALCSRYSCYLMQSQSALILESYFS